MKQILQDIENGATILADVPVPIPGPNEVLIRTHASLVSTGTERMLVDFGRANLINKARQQPDRVKQAIDKARTDGIVPTIKAINQKLSQPIPLGYSQVGIIEEIGAEVSGFSIGDRVVSNGHHAEYVCVSTNLCAKVPDAVDDESAAFTVIGAIALQGIRLLNPTLGESVVVIGLGLVGLMAAQLLKAHGCRVLGIERDPERAAFCRSLGIEALDTASGVDPETACLSFSRNRGVDGVLITASTQSNEPVELATAISRKRGRIVLTGVTGTQLSRDGFFEKELSFQVSCSYGPGRYDPDYEGQAVDYPLAYVRWTEQRNFEAVLDMMAAGQIATNSLITHRFDIKDAACAYDLLSDRSAVGIILTYPQAAVTETAGLRLIRRAPKQPSSLSNDCRLGIIGTGNYARQVLIPAFRRSGAEIQGVASKNGVTAAAISRKFEIEVTTTDARELIQSPDNNAIVIATRHNSHAQLCAEALAAGKHVFVEKPLAISLEELDRVVEAYESAPNSPVLMVGFNRRFSPLVEKLKNALDGYPDPSFIITVNAGSIPADHWTQSLSEGGGRIIGEACHFIDLLRFLAGSPVANWTATGSTDTTHPVDNASMTLEFESGAFGTIHYLSKGHRSFPKERLEVFAGGGVARIDNFRSLRGYGLAGLKSRRLLAQDKGQNACTRAFVDAVRDSTESISFAEIAEVSKLTIDISEHLN